MYKTVQNKKSFCKSTDDEKNDETDKMLFVIKRSLIESLERMKCLK